MTGSTWQFGGFAPVFNGPDFSPLSIITTDTGSKVVGTLFTLDFGTPAYTNTGDTPTGVTFHSATGSYTWAGSAQVGTWAMITRCTGSDASYTEYSWTLIVNAATNKPLFTGPIDDQIFSGDFTFNAGAFFTGATSYAVSTLPAGLTFSTVTGIFTGVALTLGTGLFGPFTVTATNGAGSTAANAFSITGLLTGTPGDYTDAGLQALLDPGGNFTGFRITHHHQPGDTSKICYYVVPNQTNRGRARWVEVLATDDSVARANKIIIATSIPAQPVWPLAT